MRYTIHPKGNVIATYTEFDTLEKAKQEAMVLAVDYRVDVEVNEVNIYISPP